MKLYRPKFSFVFTAILALIVTFGLHLTERSEVIVNDTQADSSCKKDDDCSGKTPVCDTQEEECVCIANDTYDSCGDGCKCKGGSCICEGGTSCTSDAQCGGTHPKCVGAEGKKTCTCAGSSCGEGYKCGSKGKCVRDIGDACKEGAKAVGKRIFNGLTNKFSCNQVCAPIGTPSEC